MKLTRQNLSNIAIAAIALILFSAFVYLATKGGNNGNNLATVAPTTSTSEPATTSTTEPETTTTALEATSTTAATATTVKVTTTTARPASTTTTSHGCASGQTTEQSDNKNTFTFGAGGWTSGSSSAQPGNSSFPLEFSVTTARGAIDPNNNVQYKVELTNNTACTATFGDNINVVITVHPQSGGDITFTIAPDDQHKVTDIKSHETIKLTQERALSGSGTFEATGACAINYG